MPDYDLSLEAAETEAVSGQLSRKGEAQHSIGYLGSGDLDLGFRFNRPAAARLRER